MAAHKFSATQLERFTDRIENCLNDPSCRSVLEFYLSKVLKKDNLSNVLKLWLKAHEGSDDMEDFIDNVDGFNYNTLLTLSELPQKVAYVKSECCRLLTKSDTHRRFMAYLEEKYKQ